MLYRLHRAIVSSIPFTGTFSRSFNFVPPKLSMASSDKVEVATFASGCFWGTEHIFVKHYGQKGILKTAVGFTGGDLTNPTYRDVCSRDTGHAEALRIEYDPGRVGYAELVEFFYRTHDPTTLNRQGNDTGTQYRSAIFTHSLEQDRIAKQVTDEVQTKHFDPIGRKIVTAILPVGEWWPADESHQMYLFKNPNGYQCATHRLHW
ncbi:Peptide methionine sulfoxide reductase [Ceratobasidium theobromae]|uniref:peptide-methionine (S)-S-oxide reductase n=1 Tax=Ceratobasidium theobromae TaxID=1582974 RepID=A0A5N5QEW9_9AGAM|nr:Peptide methionine sulfoxide reductase [Ceratobasidium theobromae]